MKNYLNIGFVALSLFLASQSVQAMSADEDKSSTPTVTKAQSKKSLGEIGEEHINGKIGVISTTLWDLYLWGTDPENLSKLSQWWKGSSDSTINK